MSASVHRPSWPFFFFLFPPQPGISWSLKQSEIKPFITMLVLPSVTYWADVYDKQRPMWMTFGDSEFLGRCHPLPIPFLRQISCWDIFLGRMLKLAVWINTFLLSR